MEKAQGERWHCMNPTCKREEILNHSEGGLRGNPRCICGEEMKKTYSPPVFRYLEFLRLAEPVVSEATPQEECQ